MRERHSYRTIDSNDRISMRTENTKPEVFPFRFQLNKNSKIKASIFMQVKLKIYGFYLLTF